MSSKSCFCPDDLNVSTWTSMGTAVDVNSRMPDNIFDSDSQGPTLALAKGTPLDPTGLIPANLFPTDLVPILDVSAPLVPVPVGVAGIVGVAEASGVTGIPSTEGQRKVSGQGKKRKERELDFNKPARKIRQKRFVPEEEKTLEYYEMRAKNTASAKASREKRREKEIKLYEEYQRCVRMFNFLTEWKSQAKPVFGHKCQFAPADSSSSNVSQ